MELARQKAFKMKDELVIGFREIRDELYYDDAGKQKRPRDGFTPVWTSEPEGIEWLQKVDVFFDHLINELENTNALFGEICDEVYIITRTVNRNGDSTTLDLATCSKEAFGIAMTRICLKENNLQMQYAPNWQQFAKHYAKYVMSVASTN